MVFNIRQNMPENLGMRLIQKLCSALDDSALGSSRLDYHQDPIDLSPNNS
jgi:hypothetical protein